MSKTTSEHSNYRVNGLLHSRVKKQLQTLLLHDEAFTKRMFSELQKNNAKSIIRYPDDNGNKEDYVEVPVDELMRDLVKVVTDQRQEIIDNSIATLELLELITLNQMKLQKEMDELIAAFTGSKKQRTSKMEILQERLKSEGKGRIKRATRRIKEMNQYQTWFKRRLSELKKGEPI